MRGVNSAHDGLSMTKDTGRKPSTPCSSFSFQPQAKPKSEGHTSRPAQQPYKKTWSGHRFRPDSCQPQKKTYFNLLPSSNLLTFASLKNIHINMENILQSNIRQAWLESLLWIFFLTNLLQNQSVIFSILGTIIYALLVAGALLSASYTFKKLKADRRQLSRNHCACLVILILSCLGYTLTYVVIGLRQLL